MVESKERTARGFRIYARIPERDGGTLWVQESSLAGEGPHVRLLIKDTECDNRLGHHIRPEPHLNAKQARALIAALKQFLKETK